jgi:hypothetical protein
MFAEPHRSPSSVPIDPSALVRVASFPGLHALAWSEDVLYASRGYQLFSGALQESMEWKPVARFSPPVWRHLTSRIGLAHRLVRDGFHALNVLPSGHMVGAVPGAIITRRPNQPHFEITHKISRGTRPLHIASTPPGTLYWGEYFDNRDRSEVFIYGSSDKGTTWSVAYVFPAKEVRHVHNIVHDPWQNCLWILTGDYEHECRILRASCDLQTVEPVLEGNQQARAVALLPTPDALYFSSDTPLEANYIYRLSRRGELAKVATINGSSIYGCAVGSDLFFSTMVEPSSSNASREVHIYTSHDGSSWQQSLAWKKDAWSMRYFQYGNAILPDGVNHTNLLAVTTIAVRGADQETGLWRVNSPGLTR